MEALLRHLSLINPYDDHWFSNIQSDSVTAPGHPRVFFSPLPFRRAGGMNRIFGAADRKIVFSQRIYAVRRIVRELENIHTIITRY